MKRESPRKIRLGFTLKVYKKSGEVTTYTKRSKRAFLNKIASVHGEKYFLRTYYGKGLTNENRRELLFNEGFYNNKNDLRSALSDFTEQSLLNDIQRWTEERG